MKRLGILMALVASFTLLSAATVQAQGISHRNRNMSSRDLNTASDLIGTKIENQKGENLGSVTDLLVDPHGGSVQYVILSRGGVLGVGSKLYPVPWQAMHYSIQGDRFILDLTEDRLASAPNFARESWPDLTSSDWQKRIQSFYQSEGIGGMQGQSQVGSHVTEGSKTLIRASKLMDKALQNSQNQRLGSIDNLVIDRGTGKVEYAVVGTGGVLGVGDKLHAVPWQTFEFNGDRQALVLDANKQKIDNAPSFSRDKWPDMSDPTWQSKVDRYFNVQMPQDKQSPLRGEPSEGAGRVQEY